MRTAVASGSSLHRCTCRRFRRPPESSDSSPASSLPPCTAALAAAAAAGLGGTGLVRSGPLNTQRGVSVKTQPSEKDRQQAFVCHLGLGSARLVGSAEGKGEEAGKGPWRSTASAARTAAMMGL